MSHRWAVAFAILITAAAAGATAFDAPARTWRAVDPELARVAVAASPVEVARQRGFAVAGDQVQVIVVAAEGRAAEVAAWLEAGGASDVASRGDLVQAFVSPRQLVELDADEAVRWVRVPREVAPPGPLPPAATARPKLLAVTSEGLAAANAEEWQADGFTGAGLKVGVIDTQFGGYQDLLGSELPPESMVTYQRFGGTLNDTRVHGTACAEIVHDLAPDASLHLALVRTLFDTTRAIDWMASEGVDVVTMSLGSSEGPGDGTGREADAIADYVNNGERLFVTSAGNERTSHWQGAAVDADGNDLLEFNADGDEVLYISPSVAANEQIQVSLMWNDWDMPTQDLSLHLYSVTNGGDLVEVDVSDFGQSGLAGQQPLERVTHTSSETTRYAVGVSVNHMDRPVDLEMFVHDYSFDGYVEEGSLTIPADTAEAMSVAALRYSSYSLESFSSAGPTNGPGGSLAGGRLKPDIGGYDGVSTVSYGTRSFYGTSSASPHVAGAAALAWSANPGWNGADAWAFLVTHAIDRAPGGLDNDTGAGRLSLGPSPLASCSYQLVADSATVGAARSAGRIEVTTGDGCFWSASSQVSWLLVAPDARTGSTYVSFVAEANDSEQPRVGTVAVAEHVFTVTQEGADLCGFVLEPAAAELGPQGGPGTFAVSAADGCDWTATTTADWISFTGATAGSGPGIVGYRVDSNPTDLDRAAEIAVGGESHTVIQTAGIDSLVRSRVGGVADVAGAGDTRWKSSFAVLNRTADLSHLLLSYRHDGAESQVALNLQSGAQMAWDNVAAELFGLDGESSGLVEVLADTPVLAAARTFNDAPSGTFGQLLPGVGADDGLALGETAVLAPLVDNADFRTNAGIVNTGDTTAVASLQVVGADGVAVGNPVDITAGPGEWAQVNRVLRAADANPCDLCYGVVTLTSGDGAWAYGSVIDFGSGDPTTVPMVPAATAKSAGRLVRVAGIADAEGANGTRWKSQLVVVNLADVPTAVDLTYRFGGGEEQRSLQLMAGQTASWSNVAVDLFGRESSSGAVEVSADNPVAVTARTFNQGDGGTFGQFLPGVVVGEGIVPGRPGVLPQLRSTDAFRTNVGFVNLSDLECTGAITLWHADGSAAGNPVGLAMQAGGWNQRNKIFEAAGAGSCESCYATVSTDTPGCELWAYGSVVDNGSGDPTTVPVVLEP